jgi:hypothetical protein
LEANVPETTHLAKYFDWLVGMPIIHLVNQYNSIEWKLIKDLIDTVSLRMAGCGYDPEIDPEPGARVYRNASTHDCVPSRTDFLKQSRTLFFSVVRLNDSTLRLSKEVEISHVGLVRRVVVQSVG